jgi:hypothetical protein
MKENESIIKHVHNFKSCLQQLLAARLTVQDDQAILTLMRSLPSSYTTFICSYMKQQGITLQSLITDLIQEETLMKDIGSTSENTSALYVGKKFCNNSKKPYFNKKFKSSQIKKVKAALNLLRKMISILSRSVFIAKNWDILSKIAESK